MTPKEITSGFDTVTVCFTKSLGCPVGAILAFNDASLRPKVKHLKHLLGGAMRQSGILAAAGIFALKNNIQHLRVDHENAALLAEHLMNFNEIRIINKPRTNIVIFEWIDSTISADNFHEKCLAKNLRFSRISSNKFRAVTHHDVSNSDILETVQIIKSICTSNKLHAFAKL